MSNRPLLILTVLLALTLCRPLSSTAQLAVYDAGNFIPNNISALQSVIIAVESVAQTINMVLELTPLDDIMAAQGIAEDLAQLGEIVSQAGGLSYDLSSLNTQIQALLDINTAPETLEGLEERVSALKQVMFECRRHALQVQTLLLTVFRTIEHLTGLINSVSAFIGNQSANQTMTQVQGTVSKTLAVMEAQQATYQRADVVEKMTHDLVVESLTRIERSRMERLREWLAQ